jgi:hypothetical protein
MATVIVSVQMGRRQSNHLVDSPGSIAHPLLTRAVV